MGLIGNSTKMSTASISALAAQLSKQVAVPSNNESMDSGVAGLHHMTHSNGNSPASLGLQTPNTSVLVDKLGDDVQQYIVDRSTRTTYLKGKFLGKVNFSWPYLMNPLHFFFNPLLLGASAPGFLQQQKKKKKLVL